MTNILFAWNYLRSFIYVTSGESVSEISRRVGVPCFAIVEDNLLKKEPLKGDVLIINKKAETAMLTPDNFPEGETAEKIKEYNQTTCLYPFQIVFIPK